MHPFSVLTLGIFVAGYITARWDLVTRLYELTIFAWENGVVRNSTHEHQASAYPRESNSDDGAPSRPRLTPLRHRDTT
ncbi:N-acetylglucosaminyl transferase component (Gpi1) [Geosmithia morbida]|uniref:N-acetylglucosaminyl transferase component (Gpi1) n=1 Tax=Geosmithia morbida TaxID=1094350 RepID=A0A9P5D957_9HYPO|nr:N-acetylglucosaminyl transferase component (Gpi1) [Geosmithia morbida]KAF4126169.1 N-acetylglucosaminyl transferase component (Gpi1) [Geosmithia morbida]